MQNANRDLKKFGDQSKRIGTGLTVGLTAPLVALGAKSFSVFASFEDGMAKVKAISGATAKEFDALRANAEELGSATRFTASDVAALQLNLSKLGFNPAQILKTTEGVLDLALATGEDLANSATVAASTLRGFQLSADETQRVVDVMAKSFSSSALDLEKFKTAMAVLAPVANTAGVSLEQATGQLAVLVNAGIDASTAGTGLRNVFLDIADKGITLESALQKIRSSSNQNATALSLFGKRGATVATVLAKNFDEATALGQSFENAGGSAKAMAAIMDDTAKGSMARLKSAMESAYISIGDELAPAVRLLAEYVSNLVSKFKDLDPQTKKIIVLVGALAAALGPVLVSVGFLATNVIPGLIKAFNLLKVAMVTNPYTALIGVLGLLAAAYLAFRNNVEDAAQAQSALAEVSDTAQKSIAQEKAKLEELLFIARDEQISKEHRLKAIKELNKLSPKYLGDLTLEKIKTNEAKDAIDLYIDSLLKMARVKAAQEKLQEIQSKLIDAELSASKARAKRITDETLQEKLRAEAIAQGISLQERQAQFYGALDKGSELRVNGLKEEEKQLLELITANKLYDESLLGGADGATGGDSGERVKITTVSTLESPDFATANTGLQEHIDLLTAVRDQFPPMSAEYEYLSQQIAFHNDTIKNSMGTMADTSGLSVNQVVENLDLLRQKAVAVGNAAAGAFEGFSNRLVDSLGLAANGFEGFIRILAQTVIDLIAQMLAASIAYAIQTGSAAGAATGAAGVVTTPVFISTAVAGVLAAFAAIPKFADGGIVYGPTMGLMGEYRGAINNPEVIAPLNKLKELIGGGDPIIIGGELTADGNKLRVLLNRTDSRNSRLAR